MRIKVQMELEVVFQASQSLDDNQTLASAKEYGAKQAGNMIQRMQTALVEQHIHVALKSMSKPTLILDHD